jgi:hypothetical protein
MTTLDLETNEDETGEQMHIVLSNIIRARVEELKIAGGRVTEFGFPVDETIAGLEQFLERLRQLPQRPIPPVERRPLH